MSACETLDGVRRGSLSSRKDTIDYLANHFQFLRTGRSNPKNLQIQHSVFRSPHSLSSLARSLRKPRCSAFIASLSEAFGPLAGSLSQ
jgi:hypothetical protein